jgi:hypothetical protein
LTRGSHIGGVHPGPYLEAGSDILVDSGGLEDPLFIYANHVANTRRLAVDRIS